MFDHPPYMPDVAARDSRDLIEKLKFHLNRTNILSMELDKRKATVILKNLA